MTARKVYGGPSGPMGTSSAASPLSGIRFSNASCPAPTGHLPPYLPAVCTENRPCSAFQLYIQMPFRPSRSLSRTVCTENRPYSVLYLYIQIGCVVLNMGQMAVGGQDGGFDCSQDQNRQIWSWPVQFCSGEARNPGFRSWTESTSTPPKHPKKRGFS